ncbi:hypothetical protein [Nocardioides nanhaiensis]|uniref:Uncharacterized protein n=1 Tax=Nocardioides nanhaiensis TaxID=1476871 RepID=A0ABP8VTM8_9ACTN
MFDIDPTAVLATGRTLVRHGLDVADDADDAAVPAPDTGTSRAATAAGLELLLTRSHTLSDALRGTGDGLEAFVESVVELDGEVGALHGLLLMQVGG